MSNAPLLDGIHHLKLPVTDIERSLAWYQDRLGYVVRKEFIEHGVLMGIAMTHPNGGPDLALRVDPDRARAAAGFDYFAIGVPGHEAIDALASHFTARGDAHAGVQRTPVGWVLPGIHDPDGHEVRFYTVPLEPPASSDGDATAGSMSGEGKGLASMPHYAYSALNRRSSIVRRRPIREPRPESPRAGSSYEARKGVRIWRAVPLLAALLVVSFALAPAAGASKPEREVVPAPDAMVFTGQCDFDVLGQIEGGEIDTTFFDTTGDPVKKIGVFPGQTLTLTNLATEETITVVNAGSTQARAKRDGSVEISIMGHGPLQNEIAGGEPGLWYLNGGRVVVTLDAEGNPESVTVRGNVVNLCERLAPAP